jgi:hypothetical protein
VNVENPLCSNVEADDLADAVRDWHLSAVAHGEHATGTQELWNDIWRKMAFLIKRAAQKGGNAAP